ncbi:MAG: bifunctional isocitrate dehydrogenase kinase/phosphatase [Pseudomonadota bacterium]|nr:bifunctional isocitrate dehydrogenase kinase/phosphatase [Pseudomonadota bacterium]
MSQRLAKSIAGAILRWFDHHFEIFQTITRAARESFESADWEAERQARKERIYGYDRRVAEALDELRTEYNLEQLDSTLWQEVKLQYMGLLYRHRQPELAESFYNSVFCRLFHRCYYNNDYIFYRPGLSTDHIDIDDPAYRSFYPADNDFHGCFQQILNSFDFSLPWEDADRDIAGIEAAFAAGRPEGWWVCSGCQLQVLSSLFYRNKAAYLVGRGIMGKERFPFVIAILNDERGALYVDAVITDPGEIAIVFSFSRAYFMVESRAPSGVVEFLVDILPSKTRADLYTCIGFQKQGKTIFYREFLHYLRHSSDKLVVAPGIRGMVMCVFTFPYYPYVFKVIRDRFKPPKTMTRQDVKDKYQLVKIHDRVGRMADSWEFSHAAFPVDRFSLELLQELQLEFASGLEFDQGYVIIRHLYIEHKMVPLNIYIEGAGDEDLERVIRDYGNAIKELISANIFPGDMLLKNFGVTRQGRVVFYDYDEICYMTEVNFRRIPAPRTPEEELADEPWFNVGPDDVFPEQFEHFVVSQPRVKKLFMKYHSDLLDPDYWKRIQRDLRQGLQMDVFPYPERRRLSDRPALPATGYSKLLEAS